MSIWQKLHRSLLTAILGPRLKGRDNEFPWGGGDSINIVVKQREHCLPNCADSELHVFCWQMSDRPQKGEGTGASTLYEHNDLRSLLTVYDHRIVVETRHGASLRAAKGGQNREEGETTTCLFVKQTHCCLPPHLVKGRVNCADKGYFVWKQIPPCPQKGEGTFLLLSINNDGFVPSSRPSILVGTRLGAFLP